MFKDKLAYEFYQPQTNTLRRVQCFKEILHRSIQLQKHIVRIYHEHVSNQKDSSKKIYNLIYQISKEILCGKCFNGLVDSIQSQTRISFTNFASNVFKFIINDYGLDTLSILSNQHQNDYHSMLELIDYASFSNDENKDSISQGLIQLNIHYACIPQTPLYHLFHQRIKVYADEIKLMTILKQNQQRDENADELRRDYYAIPPTTTTSNYHYVNDDDENDTAEHFRYKLMKAIANDKVLNEIINEHILHSYSNDLVRTFCTIVEKNFDDNLQQCEKTIEFVSRWLLLVDDNDRQSLEDSPNKYIWLLSHVYASFEYDQNDLFSLYSACRITDQLDSTRSFYEDLFDNEDHITRSDVREKLFRSMFDYLWKYLCELCSTNQQSDEKWIHAYTFISKYYPSEKVLSRTQLINIKDEIDFMNLAYLIFLNDKTPQPKQLVAHLLKNLHQNHHHAMKSMYLKLIPKIIELIQNYLDEHHIINSTLMIDVQQWIILMLKSTTDSCKDEIKDLFHDLNQSSFPLSLPMKQFLFDELANLYLRESERTGRDKLACWNRGIILLPVIIECIDQHDDVLKNYHLPSHPSMISTDEQRQSLFDLFFFHLQRSVNNELITCNFVNKIIQSKLPNQYSRTTRDIFKPIHIYFIVKLTAVLLCQSNISADNQAALDRITRATISSYLTLNNDVTQLSDNLQLFLSTIISKRSWNYLLNLLKSESIQRFHSQWANTLFQLLQIQQTTQRNEYLQLCHQIQFTLSINQTSSIFPQFHQIYNELKTNLTNCINNNQQWNILSDWIQLQQNPNLTEIKVMLLLNIYYDYYCTNQLASLNTLLPFIENTLEPLPEELRVFRALLQPEQHMIGYSRNQEENFLNHLFRVDCKDEDELPIRHSLVNLLAMILLGGKQNFLWTFTFQPLTLQNTFGFGSTARSTIQANGVHYDSGCIITQNGDLAYFDRTRVSVLNVPAVYVAYFATFGALAWHLLLYNESVQNLHGPILAPHAIADNTAAHRLAGNDQRTKVCHFVRARLLSTFNFLSTHSNSNDASILLNRCFEQMAFLTLNQQQEEDSWIKPVYQTIDDQLKAEEEFQNKVFYFIHQKLAEHKAFVNQLDLQSQIQAQLQDFITKMPIEIQFRHFKTELHNPIHSEIPLNMLRHVLDSTDFLKMTKWIHNLTQFYLLLHQTYAQLIERNEFLTVSLEELYQRGEKHSKNYQSENRNNNYSTIIDHGIEAVNAYHDFTDGLIRPGACDQTQRFTKITRETPIHYLVTTGSLDEGDIVMRILRVLIDYHNSLLKLLEQEVNNDANTHVVGALQKLINNLTSKEVSIVQIVRDNTGVITLTDQNCSWLEQLSRATLITETNEYFQQIDTPLNFDFLYLQSYIIRTYLLLCRINYEHIIQNYQCHIRRTQQNTTNEVFDLDKDYCAQLSDQQLENNWSYLKEMYLDKLYHGHNLLRQIAIKLHHQQENVSQMYLYEFIQTFDHEKKFYEQIHQNEIKDFQLCYFDHIRQLYANSICDFQHLFTDVSQILRTPIPIELEIELGRMLQAVVISVDSIDEIKSTIQTVTDLLNDLRDNEYFLQRQWAESLTETCELLSIKNTVLNYVSAGIKCENYVPLCIYLIRMRSTLQERTVNIEEKESKQWNESMISDSVEQQPNRFREYLNQSTEPDEPPPTPIDPEPFEWPNIDPTDVDPTAEFMSNSTNGEHRPEPAHPRPLPNLLEETFESFSLFELTVALVPLSTSKLFEKIHDQNEQPTATDLKKGLRFTVTDLNEKAAARLWRSENLCQKLREFFKQEKLDENLLGVIDQNKIFLDFSNDSCQLPKQICQEYRIIRKDSLFTVQFQFRENQFDYFMTSDGDISVIINRFIADQNIEPSSEGIYLCFFDEQGKSIENETIADLSKRLKNPETKTIPIIVIEENLNTKSLSQVTLRTEQNQERIGLFRSDANWNHVNEWLKRFTDITDPPSEYAFLSREQQIILDDEQSISSTIEQLQPTIIDGISRNSTTKVTFTYENNSVSINTLKSSRISHLLNNENLLRRLNLIDISPNDCVLVLGETNEQVLSQEDIRQPLTAYLSAEDRSVHFRISIMIQILRYDNSEPSSLLLPSRNVTMEHIFQSIDNVPANVYKYLASNSTKKIIDNCEKLSNLHETKFLLVKENETCFISVKKSKTNQLLDLDDEQNAIHQRFTIYAQIRDIYQENQLDIDRQYCLYSNDFVPSIDTQLFLFPRSNSTIEFALFDQNLPFKVTIQNKENQQTIQFHCSLTINVGRLQSIACQLFTLNGKYYVLKESGCTLDDEDITLNEINSAVKEIELQLEPKPTIHSSIKFGERIIELPCSSDTLVEVIIKEALDHFHVCQEDYPIYELFALTDDGESQMDDTYSIENIYELFPSRPTTIPFELKRKQV
ncbi:unnamed protein product [Adineta ricciae]|uniref:Uncharacterized protein n=2 Tax=Adineta ricciae TaxID=249248 RepID=A0A815U0N3_ADIRI|nr:unnamed protein product [Adineta ricciae]